MAIHEIRVTARDEDPLGHEVKQEAERTLGIRSIRQVNTAKVYRVQGVEADEAERLASELFADPVNQQFTVDEPAGLAIPDKTIEVAYRPGVMNPVVASIIEAATALGVGLEAADASHEYGFKGKVGTRQIGAVASRLLANKTVEQIVTTPPKTLTFEGSVGPVEVVPVRTASEKELMDLSKDKLFLDPTEMKVIQEHFKGLDRDPTDCELEIIAARWSEHCGHKTFNAKVIVEGVEKPPLFARIKEAAQANFGDLVVSAFKDNAGIMKLYDGQAIFGKVETHNSPSAVEPYGGAMTGTGGVLRDGAGVGKGGKNLISTDHFCFAPWDIDVSKLPVGTLHPDYLQRRVVQGVRDYGNRMGIPTGNGSVHYHEDFRAKPSVIVGAYGIIPEKYAEKGEPEVGDLVVIIGGRTGRDGIHGATFSSGEMTDRTASVNSSAVQIGNAIEEKRMFDALIEARDLGHIKAITDCGAAGFSSAIGEIGEEVGVTVDISKAPLKYPGLAPWEIWLSESQERMVAAIGSDNIEEFMEVCRKYNVEATVLGEFDGSHTLTVNYGDQNVAELDYGFLKDGLPQRVMTAHWEKPLIDELKPEAPKTAQEWIGRFKSVLSHGNVCSKEPIVRQYDHGVQGGNIVGPYGGINQDGPNDALVVRPVLDKPYGVVQSHGMNPILNRLDPFEGSIWAVTEAMANYVAVGGNPDEVALVNNYIWPFPDKEAMGSLDQSVDAVVEMMHTLGAPVISGKDSLSSTYRGKDGEVIKIPPVLTISAFGRIPDVERTTTSDIKKPGSELYLVGQLSEGMGGSTYYDITGGQSGEVPKVDRETLMPTLRAVYRGIHEGSIAACHDVSEGGVLTTVAEMCFGGGCGAEINVPGGGQTDETLFNETAGCFVVELPKGVNPGKLFRGVPHVFLGTTTEEKIICVIDESSQDNLFEVSANELKQAWQAPLKEVFHS